MEKIEAEGKAALETAPTSCPVSNAVAWKIDKMDPILLWLVLPLISLTE